MPKIRVSTGFELFYREDGEGDPILWIMGLGNDHRGWAYQVPAFRDREHARYRSITFDNRDSGQSQLAESAYATADMAEDAVALLDVLEIERAHVIGFSMGGAQAQEVAIRHPQRVGKLVLCNTYTSSDPRGEEIFRGRALQREKLSLEEATRLMLPWVYTVEDYKKEGFIEATVRSILDDKRPQPIEAFRRQIEATLDFDTRSRLGQIGAETLVIFGEDDITTPLRFARELEAGIPNSTLALVPQAGHGLPWSHAEVFNKIVGGFLEGKG